MHLGSVYKSMLKSWNIMKILLVIPGKQVQILWNALDLMIQ